MRTKRDGGSGTVWVLSAASVVLLVGCTAIATVSAVVARHRAASAADLAALSAATRAADRHTDGCAVARRTVDVMGGRLVRCSVSGLGVASVTVTVRPAGLAGRVGSATVRARAGPATAGVPSGPGP